MKSISYAITVKDEFDEIQRLVPFLLNKKRPKDEIVILYDQKNGDKRIPEYLATLSTKPNVQFWRGFFENHFGEWKNLLTSYCKNDYIFQIDADEMPNESLVDNLPEIIEGNDIDVYLVPRVNTVDGLKQEHITEWKWNVNSKGWVNWPDYQWRLYKNIPQIKWKNRVHEVLTGFKTYTTIPAYEELAIFHPKEISRQIRQNSFYNTL